MSETQDKAQSSFKLNPMDELNDLRMSAKALPLLEHVRRFIKETVQPMSQEFHRLGAGKADIWSYAPGQLECLEKAKDKAQELMDKSKETAKDATAKVKESAGPAMEKAKEAAKVAVDKAKDLAKPADAKKN